MLSSYSYVTGQISIVAETDKRYLPLSVQFYIDGTEYGSPVTSYPYKIVVDTTALDNGPHSVKAITKYKDGGAFYSSAGIGGYLVFHAKCNDTYEMVVNDSTDNPVNLNTDGWVGQIDFTERGVRFSDNVFVESDYFVEPHKLLMTGVFSIHLEIFVESLVTVNSFGLRNICFAVREFQSNSINYQIQVDTESSLKFYVRVPGNALKAYSFTGIPSLVNRSAKITFIYDGGTTLSLYVDGVFHSSSQLVSFTDVNTGLPAYFGTTSLNNHVMIGGSYPIWNEVGETFVISIKNVRMYDINLSSQAIIDLHNGNYTENNTTKLIVENISNVNLNTSGIKPPIVRGVNTFIKSPILSSDLQVAKSWGVNVVRGWIQDLVVPGETFEESLAIQIENAVQQAILMREAGLKLILVVYNLFNVWNKQVWSDAQFESNFIKIWTDLATALLPYSDVIYGFDLCNEPNQYRPGHWRELSIKIISSIRAINHDVWIIYEPGYSGGYRSIKNLYPLQDKKIIYSFHFYTPSAFCANGLFGQPYAPDAYPGMINGTYWDTPELYKRLDFVKSFQQKYDVDIYVGEFSVIRWASESPTIKWMGEVIEYFEEAGWSWCYFAFRAHWKGWDIERVRVWPYPVDNNPAFTTTESTELTLIKSYLAKNNE